MHIEKMTVKAAKADMVKGEITITLTVPMDDDTTRYLRANLAPLADTEAVVDVEITQRNTQISMTHA